MQIVGTPTVANGTSAGGLMTRRTSKRKKKYHSGRGTYVVVVGSAFGPSSAPSTIDIVMMTIITITAITLSLATAYGKNGLPLDLRIAYSRRYCSFSWWFMSDALLQELLVLLGLQPRRRGGAELGHEIEVRADHGGDHPWHEEHVDRVEPRQGGGAELGAPSQEVRQERTDQRAGAVDVHPHDRGPVGALVEREQVARERHQHREDQQDDADDPVQLPRVLVRAEEERPRHVQEDQDHHHGRSPLVHPAHELAEEDVVGDVARRFVGLRGRRRVVHGQEHAGGGLRQEREHRGRAERVEPVGPLRDLAEEHPADAARQRRPLVDPVDRADPRLAHLLERPGLVALARARGRRLEALRQRGGGELHGTYSFGVEKRPGYMYWPMPSSGWPGSR